MIKELKYFFFIVINFIFLFLIINFYFSDNNKKNSYRSLKLVDKKNVIYFQKLILLKDDTNEVIEIFETTTDNNKRSYNFWKLINNND
jgi:hypothetical protein|tara:strand:- start:134 stop:397 length:264 start_codon:yes stop_codon:yes gene_type:complete